MDKKIIVAGAGHGGLVAAAKLAEYGYTVVVVEKSNPAEIGHDAEDRFDFANLTNICGISLDKLPEDIWRYRGDCAFVSPSKRKKIIIRYKGKNKQKVMWRRPLLALLMINAKQKGVKFMFDTEIISSIVENNKVVGVSTSVGDLYADMIIDSCGVFSPVRMSLPYSFCIEKHPGKNNVFYSYRAYFNKISDENPDVPFEVYMKHNGESGLSWVCTNPDSVDILIGRTEPLKQEHIDELVAEFRAEHPWMGDTILHGGKLSAIPVRRPLSIMVADNYAAVGDAAFMTTPMNGMGIDLSIKAGKLLADCIISNGDVDLNAQRLWKYNYNYLKKYAVEATKNEGLKNAILDMKKEGLDFLFEKNVIEKSDLAGAGKNMNAEILLGKFVRGMKNPPYFIALVKGLINGSLTASKYKKLPLDYYLALDLVSEKKL